MSDALEARLAKLLAQGAEPDPGALPIERLAGHLAGLAQDPSALRATTTLLGDGLTGGLLYRTHPELVLTALERSLPALDRAGRFDVLDAVLRMRPQRSEDLLRYLSFGLDAMGLSAGASRAWESLSTQELRVVYRWSDALRYATAHQSGEIAALLAERGVAGDGGHAWDVFMRVIGYKPTVLVTPRMSPTVRHELESMQRHDWLDMPWMFGGAKATFTLDEIEEDSSPENMQDGDRIARSLIAQRRPSFDFFAKTFAWHPRQTLERVREVALERGFDLVEPASHDLAPRRLMRHELSHADLALQARAVRAMAKLDASRLPVDVALSFFDGEEGAYGALEFSLTSVLKSSAKKFSLQVALGDPEQLVAALREHASLLTPAALPLLLAKLFAASPSIRVAVPEGPAIEIDAQSVAAWDASASLEPQRASPRAAVSAAPEAILGTWRGRSRPDQWPDYQPFVLTLRAEEGQVHGVADTPDAGLVEVVGSVREGRLALRQPDPHGTYLLEARWDQESGKLEGRYRQYGGGGDLELELESAPGEAPSAEELIDAALAPWSEGLRFDIAALRFPGEEAMMRALFEDEHFRAAYLESAANRATGADAMNIDALVGRGSSQLTRAMLPSAFRALDAVVAALGLSDEVRLWVHNDFTLNAFVTLDARVIDVHLTSGLLEVLHESELQAAIGHELGHVLVGTHDLALRVRNTRMSGETRKRYFALRRHQELSADRISLLACADPAAVFVTQTMLRTGIRKRDLFGGVESLIDNAKAEVEALRRSRKREDLAFDSHPWSALRTVALELFSQTEQFRSLRPDASTRAQRSEAELAAELSSLSELLDVPEAKPKTSEPTRSPARFMALAALRVVEADQSIAVRELAALEGLGEQVRAELEEVLDWTHERRDIAILDAGREVTDALSVPEREALLGQLLTVVRADNVVQYAETGVLEELGRLLAVDTHSFRKTMEELYRSAR